MKGILFKKYTSVTRWLLLVGVFSAMFFSNGEGIQLLPFSDSDKADGAITQSSTNKLDSYVYSALNSSSQRNSLVSKHQKNLKNPALNHGFSIRFSQEFAANVVSAQTQNFSEVAFLASSIVLSQPSDRGPPVV